ncbi:hypothetical protein K402DRAFT_327594 [Aulographum hederae CBS 113979]|uniref:Serine hydrolase domain-containing protein n=1 Tax=Aulographum hederae CBS 113979 TaxID=1176131 RepID=A0A6G1H6T4_9PEZI|nr:hypothetical protein K402DRAFT_327594 [Aulographum hederae CBS 113979]
MSNKILCLHGAGTSAAIMKSQFSSIASELERSLSATLFYVDASLNSPPHKAVDGIYDGPFKTWFTWSGEDPPLDEDIGSILDSFDQIYDIIEENGPFDGVIGFSQGATIAAAMLLHHHRQHPLDPPYALFKYSVLVSAAAIVDVDPIPILRDGKRRRLIQIPTLHVLGEEDDLFGEGIAMSKICAPQIASVLVHKQGHVIPRDPPTVKAVVKAVEALHHRAMIV